MLGIMLVAYLYVLIFGIMLWIAGSEPLTEQVRQALPPNEVEFGRKNSLSVDCGDRLWFYAV
jgi:hypothetical protein